MVTWFQNFASPVLGRKSFLGLRGVISFACLEHPHQLCFERCTSAMFFQTTFWNWFCFCYTNMWRKEISWGIRLSGTWRCFICQKNGIVVANDWVCKFGKLALFFSHFVRDAQSHTYCLVANFDQAGILDIHFLISLLQTNSGFQEPRLQIHKFFSPLFLS
jgi:hypothetical protein